jgi:undecaprenyl-diphosphatase
MIPRVPPRQLLHQARSLPRWLWARERRWWLLLAASLSALGTFLEISEELIEDDDLTRLDLRVLRTVAALRLPWLTISFIDITALGSLTLLGLVTVCTAVPLWRIGDRRGALHLLVAVLGAGLWTLLTKLLFARARPDLDDRLLDVHGFSFPSGHSAGAAALYITLAFVLGRHVRTLSGRSLLAIACCVLVVLIAFSRVYLGVHYPSDVVSGILFGGGWALLLSALVEWRHAVALIRQNRLNARSSGSTPSASSGSSVP